MAATLDQINQVRRMAGEVGSTTYTDGDIRSYIETYPLLDERGQEPYTYDTSTEPPTQDANEDWIATYDLNAAAADIWDEKAGAVAHQFDFNADGASYNVSQKHAMYMRQAKHYRARRSVRTVTLVPWAKSVDDDPEDVLSN